MNSPQESSTSAGPLPARILAELSQRPGRRAADLAVALGVDRKEINRCLSDQLAGQVRQDQSYHWYVLEAAADKPAAAPGAVTKSDLARLCRYYLECIGQDNDEGVADRSTKR